MYRYLLLSVLLCITSVSGAKIKDDGSQIQADNSYPQVKLETTMGDIIVELNRSKAPAAVNNFLRYALKRGYEGTIFHRVIADFVVQGGGYDENFAEIPSWGNIINESGNGLKNEKYTIAMARQRDPHSANHQFYFNLADNPSLDPGRDWGYTVFGTVIEGYDVLDKIALSPTDIDPTYGWPDVPIEKIMLKRVLILPMQF